MIVNIDSSKLTDSPYSADRKGSFLIESNDSVEQVVLELKYAAPSSFLISGYRGVGKTSFVNRIKEQVDKEFICVSINLAKYDGYPTLVKKLIRELYLQFSAFNNGKTLSDKDQQLDTDFKLLYDRTFHDIVNSHIINSKKERKISTDFEWNLKKLLPVFLVWVSATNLSFDWLPSKVASYLLFVGAFIWTCLTSLKLNFSKSQNDSSTSETSRKSLYDDNIAEHHLLHILQRLQNQGYKVIVAFDEIDKIQTTEAVKNVISDLKFLLLSGHANFFVIAGQLLFYEFEKSDQKDDQIISTLFSKHLHIPFLKASTLKKYCNSLIFDDNQKSEMLVNVFFDSLILRSSRVPRKLVNLVRAHLLWNENQAYLNIPDDELRWFQNQTALADALIKLMDNRLPGIARNIVQLDFFIAQVYLWVIKMKTYSDGSFLMSVIMDIPSYKDNYPDLYIAQLVPLKTILIEELLEQNILMEQRSSDDEAESSYFWAPETLPSSAESSDLPDSGGDEPGPDEPDGGLPIAPSFVTDFAEFEAFLREIYKELVPDDTKRKYAFTQLVNRLIDIGVLTKTWYSSTKIKQLIETKNKVVHGEAIGPEDLNVIQASVFTLSNLKSQVIEDLTFYITQHFLQSFNVIKSKGGFDFIATHDNDVILFEVKYLNAGQSNTRNINETIDKYYNYRSANTKNLYYVLFFFQPNRRKSFDDFYVRFNDTITDSNQELKDRLHLFYVSEGNDKGIKITIEDALQKVLIKIGPRKNHPPAYFNEFEIETIDEKIKDKSLRDWPDNYEMQVSVIHAQKKSVDELKGLDANELGNNTFEMIKEKSKKEWPDDFEMQLHTFRTQEKSFKEIAALKPNVLSEADFKTITDNAKKSWPDNFEMQLHEYETQKEAVVALAAPKPDDIPTDKFNAINEKVKREWPGNFEMQLHERNNQFEALRALNN